MAHWQNQPRKKTILFRVQRSNHKKKNNNKNQKNPKKTKNKTKKKPKTREAFFTVFWPFLCSSYKTGGWSTSGQLHNLCLLRLPLIQSIKAGRLSRAQTSSDLPYAAPSFQLTTAPTAFILNFYVLHCSAQIASWL